MKKDKLPKLTINTQAVLRHAESMHLVTMETDGNDRKYICDFKEIILLTPRNGYIVINRADIPELIEELIYLDQDICRET